MLLDPVDGMGSVPHTVLSGLLGEASGQGIS